MDELQSDAARLKEMLRLKPTSGRIAEAQSALASKWEGTQSLAIRVLAAWGGRESKERIRTFLVEAFQRDHAWSIQGVAIEALAGLAGPEDVEWVLDLFFSRPDWLDKHALLPLVSRLPVDAARPRLKRELASKDCHKRCAAVIAVGRMPFPDRAAILAPLRFDADDQVRTSARTLLGEP